MCSLHLTHPTLRCPGSSWGSVPCSSLTSVVDTSFQSRDSNSQPWVTSGFKSNALSIRPRLPSPLWDAYKPLPRPPFGKSDHSSIMLLPAYRQKLKQEAPALRTIQCWSDQSDAILQDCFDHVDWDMFQAVSDDDIEAYSDTGFFRKCIEDAVPTKTVRIYTNQKPCINSDVRAALSVRTSAFTSGNTDDRKQASYDLSKSIKAAKTTI